MKNRNGIFGIAFIIVIIIVSIVAEIIGVRNQLSPMDRAQLRGYCVGGAGLIYGMIFYIVKNHRK